MNIIVKTFSGHHIVRPDTTWERDNEGFYPPEFVNTLSFTPVMFARICKPGRSVGRKFASRYFDGINFGMLLYPDDLFDGSEESFACASCLDHTSILPFPVCDKLSLGQEKSSFKLMSNGKVIFSYDRGTAGMVEEAIAEASGKIYLRSGDILAIELDSRKELCKVSDGTAVITASFCNKYIMDLKIVF